MNKAQLRWQEKGETVDVRPGYSNCHDDEDDDDEDDEVMGVLDVVKRGHFVEVCLIRTSHRMVLSDTGILPNEPQNRVAALCSTMIHPNQCVCGL